MQKCPFCGTEWEGRGPCPGCGVEPETPRDDSMFRPPEDGAGALQEAPPEFDVEKILRWEPSAETPQEEPETEKTGEAEDPDAEEIEEEEDSRPLKNPLKRWQKLTMAAVAVVVAAAIVVRLWPQTPALPQTPAFFVQNDTLMVLPVNGEPQKVAEYSQGLEITLQVSSDQKSMAWQEPNGSAVKMLPAVGEEIKIWENRYAGFPRFSQDGKYLYLPMDDEETGNSALWQYNRESGEERKIGPLFSDYFLENGTLLAAYDDTRLTVYDPNTTEEKWSQEGNIRWMTLIDDRLYFAEARKDSSRFCCWQDGKMEVLLENVDCLYFREDDVVYLQCYEGEPLPAEELVNNDLLGEEGEAIRRALKDVTVHSPKRSLYCFDGKELHAMGEDRRLYFFPEMGRDAVVCDIELPSLEEIKGTVSLQKLHELWTESSGEPNVLQMELEYQWINKVKTTNCYLAKKEKLFLLPGNVSEAPSAMKTQGDWVCFSNNTNDGLWLGKIEGEKVVFQNFFPAPQLGEFAVTPEGKVYYRAGNTRGALFENGETIVTDDLLQNVQFTEDGAVYFLNGSSASELTLNRIYQGKWEKLAENVKEFVPYTRDYVAYLQYRADGDGQDLLTHTAGKKPVLVGEKVQKLLPEIEPDEPRFDIDTTLSNLGDAGYIDMDVY